VRALQRLMLAHKLTRATRPCTTRHKSCPPKWDGETNANGASSGFGNEWLKFDAIGEMTSDGGMTIPPLSPVIPIRTSTTMGYRRQRAADVQRPDRQPQRWRFSIHSVGDAAIDWVLDASPLRLYALQPDYKDSSSA
jgi:hypothetical protein